MKIKKAKVDKNTDSYILPKDNLILEKFIIKNKETLLKQVILSIEDAIDKNKESINIFNFENSKFFVSVKREEFLENIQNAFGYFYSNKNPEMCTKISRMEDHLMKIKSEYK